MGWWRWWRVKDGLVEVVAVAVADGWSASFEMNDVRPAGVTSATKSMCNHIKCQEEPTKGANNYIYIYIYIYL